MDTLPSARIVHLCKWPSADGYGFVLKGSKSKDYRIGSVESGLPAEAAGLMENDILIEVNGQLIKDMDYGDVVQAIKHYPTKVVLMVLRPCEKNILSMRGVQLSSSTCPAQVIKGRKEHDDTTTMVCEKTSSDEVSKTIINCDSATAARLNRERLDLLSAL